MQLLALCQRRLKTLLDRTFAVDHAASDVHYIQLKLAAISMLPLPL
jgi:hypothetical protein